MITTRLMGGMGNQMFQYACGLAQARRLGTDLQVDVSLLGGKRKYVLDQWNISTPVVTGIEATVFENGMGYNADLDSRVKDGDCLQGYWQSEKYFKGRANVIRRVFAPRMCDISPYGSILHESNSVSIHIRRDDYLVSPHKEFHGVLDLDYYETAIDYIRERVENPKFYVFCEDVEWARAFFSHEDTTVVTPGQEARDINLMSLCTHAIIANSSFSWWGAWLRKCDYGIMIAPKKWFQDDRTDYSDIVPERWLRQ